MTFQAYKFDKLVKKMGVLHSWSDDADTRNFSGTARYELEFEIPPSLLAKGRRRDARLGSGDGRLKGVAERQGGGRDVEASAPSRRHASW